MSYNVDHTEYLPGEGRLSIRYGTALMLAKKYEDELPENNFLNAVLKDEKSQTNLMALLEIDYLSWSGERSGHGIDLFKLLLKSTEGEASIFQVWEGGDSFRGYRVENGMVVEKDVEITLVDKKKEKRQ
jgi:hypothetical protein